MTLSEMRLHGAAGRVDETAAITSSHVPLSGEVAYLKDGLLGPHVTFREDDIRSPGFWLQWDFGVAVDIKGPRIAGPNARQFVQSLHMQYSTDGIVWGPAASVGAYSYQDPDTLTPVPEGGLWFFSEQGVWAPCTAAGKGVWSKVSASIDCLRLAAIGTIGYSTYVYTSDDGGFSWAARSAIGARTWRNVAVSQDGLKILASAADSNLFTSTDGGGTWAERTGAGSQDFRALALSADGQRLVAAAPNWYIHTSADGGATWVEQRASGIKTWRAAATSADGLRIIAVNGSSTVYVSTDGGVTWSGTSVPAYPSINSVACSRDGMCLLAAPGSGSLFTSANGGVSWVERTGAGSQTWNGVAVSADGLRMVAVSGNMGTGDVYTSTDGGATWVKRVPAGSRQWNAAAISADGRRIVVAAGSSSYGTDYIHTIAERDGVFVEPPIAISKSIDALVFSGGMSGPAQVVLADDYFSRDMEFAGTGTASATGTIYGSTAIKGSPNAPARAKVSLLRARDLLLVQQTWSDPATGAYAFHGLDPAEKYTTLAEYPTGDYRAVAADQLTPDIEEARAP